MSETLAIAAVQNAVTHMMNTDPELKVSDALILILQVAALDLGEFAKELDPWEAG